LVTINGIVKASSLEEAGSGKTNRDKATWIIYINVNSISSQANNEKNNKEGDRTTTILDKSRLSTCNTSMAANELEFSKTDLEFFQTLIKGEYPFKAIVNSLCPSIFGHEFVKAGLVLGLFGGSKKSGNDVAVRNDVHVLVVGDPGLGKVIIISISL
jgi:DNA helicase MCM8